MLAEPEVRGADLVVFAGDVVGGFLDDDTLALARSLGERARFVRGNADREAGISDFEPTVRVEVEGVGGVLVCHATPESDEPVFTVETADERVAELLGDVDADVVVCGHTHMQFDRRVRGVRVVNAGSVGMPYAARPGAYWVLLGPDVEHRRTDYDLAAAAARIAATGAEGAEQFARENVLTVPSVDEALPYFRALER